MNRSSLFNLCLVAKAFNGRFCAEKIPGISSGISSSAPLTCARVSVAVGRRKAAGRWEHWYPLLAEAGMGPGGAVVIA